MIYVMSDIHGHRRRFDSVMKQINLQPEDTLYILGDVIDRNPDGIRILQQLRAMPNVVMLLGNHEYMMLDALYNIPDEEDAVWHRYRSHDRGPDDYTVIFGHTPTTEHQLAKPATIWNGRNLIDIDCGAAYEEIDVWGIVIKTRLACLRLDDMKEFYSEED